MQDPHRKLSPLHSFAIPSILLWSVFSLQHILKTLSHAVCKHSSHRFLFAVWSFPWWFFCKVPDEHPSGKLPSLCKSKTTQRFMPKIITEICTSHMILYILLSLLPHYQLKYPSDTENNLLLKTLNNRISQISDSYAKHHWLHNCSL